MAQDNVSGPVACRFKLNGPQEMVAHNVPEMLELLANVMRRGDKRYKGFAQVYWTHNDLVIVELNALGIKQ